MEDRHDRQKHRAERQRPDQLGTVFGLPLSLDGAWLETKAWKGHAERFFDHLVARGGTVRLDRIDAPPVEWKSVLELFEAGIEHERLVTKRIHDLAAAADEGKDYATASMLKWFIDEQVEEEAGFEEIVAQLKKIGDSDRGLFMLDHQMGKRKAEKDG